MYSPFKQEQHDPNQLISDEYWLDEWETLTEQIKPAAAVWLWRGYPAAKNN